MTTNSKPMRNEFDVPKEMFERCKDLLNGVKTHDEDFPTECHADFSKRSDIKAVASLKSVIGDADDSPAHPESFDVSYISSMVFMGKVAVERAAIDWITENFGEDAAEKFADHIEGIM